MSTEYTPEEVKKAHEVLFAEGIKMREKVAGKAFVEKSLANANNPFARAMQEVCNFSPTQRSLVPQLHYNED